MGFTRKLWLWACSAAGVAALGVYWTLQATSRFGAGTEPDSATYLSAARSLSHGHKFLGIGGEPLTFFPPLFPAAVAAAHATGLSYLSGARVVNAAAFGLLIIITVVWVRRLTGSRAGALVAGLFVALSPTLVDMGSSALSEPLFALFVALSLALLRENGRGARKLAFATGVAIAAAFLTRYVGFFLLPVAVATVGLGRDRLAWRWRAALAGPPIVAAALWFARNLRVDGSLTGLRPRSAIGLATSVNQCLGAIGAWVLPAHAPDALASIIGGVVLVGLPGSAIDARLSAWRRDSDEADPGAGAAATAAFVLLYFFGVAVLSARTALDPPPRFLLPLFVPLVALAAVVFQRNLGSGQFNRREALTGLAALALIVAGTSLPRLDDFVDRADRIGLLTYSRPQWQTSPLLAYLRTHPPTGSIFTDDPYAVSLFLDRSAVLTPERTFYNSPQPTGSTGVIKRPASGAEPAFLVWWFRSALPHYFSLEELGQKNCLEKQASFDDGEIYRLC